MSSEVPEYVAGACVWRQEIHDVSDLRTQLYLNPHRCAERESAVGIIITYVGAYCASPLRSAYSSKLALSPITHQATKGWSG